MLNAGQTDRRTDIPSYRDATAHLKIQTNGKQAAEDLAKEEQSKRQKKKRERGRKEGCKKEEKGVENEMHPLPMCLKGLVGNSCCWVGCQMMPSTSWRRQSKGDSLAPPDGLVNKIW